MKTLISIIVILFAAGCSNEFQRKHGLGNEARRLLANETEPKGKALRVYVESGGCSGMQYGLVFDEQREGDHELDFDGVPVVVDSFSTKYLQGSVVDFSDDLNDGGFKVMIPGAKTTCGCGKSFEA